MLYYIQKIPGDLHGLDMIDYDLAKGMASLSIAQSVALIRQSLTLIISDTSSVTC